MIRPIGRNYGKMATWTLVVYLSVMLSGCATRPEALPPEQAKTLQTREMSYSVDEVARGVVAVLQEMNYSLENVDTKVGIITAERTSERQLAPISREAAPEEMPDEMQTFCLVAGGLAIAALLFAWLWDDDENEDDWAPRRSHRRHIHHHPGPIFIEADDYSHDSYKYKMTVTLEPLGTYKSRIRVSVQGLLMEGPSIAASGPVHDEAFYQDFYNRLQIVLTQ